MLTQEEPGSIFVSEKGRRLAKERGRVLTIRRMEANYRNTQPGPSQVCSPPHFQKDGFLILFHLLPRTPANLIQFSLELQLIDL